MDAQAQNTSIGMQASKGRTIRGASFAVMIIIGGILGDIIFYTLLYGILLIAVGTSSILIVLAIGIILVILAALAMRKASEPSGLLYILTFLGCMGIPIFGGVALYVVAKQHGLTQ